MAIRPTDLIARYGLTVLVDDLTFLPSYEGRGTGLGGFGAAVATGDRRAQHAERPP
jgi:hypothetical protein